jgi:hypothetical protein
LEQKLNEIIYNIMQINRFADTEELNFPMFYPDAEEQNEWFETFLKYQEIHIRVIIEEELKEITKVIARNLVAWDTSKDKREGLLPEVYLANKHLYKQLIGEEYFQHKAMKMFQIGDDYY